MVFAPIVLAYLNRYPDLKVEIVTEGRMVDIVAEGFDAGIRLSEMVPQDMVRIPIDGNLRMAVLSNNPRSIDCTQAATIGWWSMRTTAQFSIVNSFVLACTVIICSNK
ncbi:hypothetical protein HHL21_20330 [Massilia sp. RP-1-19]|uniref:LysR substrate-binding domain-containing protein n=2 Tax=Massilia polaris TaxID=2728846 RepID=A0A848HVS1_9BURK|nr:hypothetical protein [Massilia polaris]